MRAKPEMDKSSPPVSAHQTDNRINRKFIGHKAQFRHSLMEFVMFEISTDLLMALYFFSVHTLIVWGVVLAWLWFNRMAERLADKRRRPDLSR